MNSLQIIFPVRRYRSVHIIIIVDPACLREDLMIFLLIQKNGISCLLGYLCSNSYLRLHRLKRFWLVCCLNKKERVQYFESFSIKFIFQYKAQRSISRNFPITYFLFVSLYGFYPCPNEENNFIFQKKFLKLFP